MRLLTHNLLKNHAADAKGNGYPLLLSSVTSIRVVGTETETTKTTTNNHNTMMMDDTENDQQSNDDDMMKVQFIKNILPTIHWSALLQVCRYACMCVSRLYYNDSIRWEPSFIIKNFASNTSFIIMNVIIVNHIFMIQNINKATNVIGITTLPNQLTDDMIQDSNFMIALYHILMNIHIVQGIMTCPITQRKFTIDHEIPNMMILED